jgi:NADP-dependent 3-hydroxy acid dehydrogenase YdfG
MELVSNNSERIILVTGATGRQGGAVYQHLQKKGFKLRALQFPASCLCGVRQWRASLPL